MVCYFAMPRALFSKPSHRFKAGDRVRCTRGHMRGSQGVVTRGIDGRIRAGPDQVWVLFDGAEAPTRARRSALRIVTSGTRN